MLEDIIKPGTLVMSAVPVPSTGDALAWGDLLVNRISVVAAIFLFILTLRDIIRILPNLLACIDRARANVSLEHSLNIARTRNLVAWETAFIFCLLADRYSLYSPGIWQLIPDGWKLPATVGILLTFILVRHLLFLLLKPIRVSQEGANTIHHTAYNCFIIATAVLLATAGALSVFHCPDHAIRSVLLWETAGLYFLTLIRTGQILNYYCNTFATFLYLCALELLPAGLLIVSVVVL